MCMCVLYYSLNLILFIRRDERYQVYMSADRIMSISSPTYEVGDLAYITHDTKTKREKNQSAPWTRRRDALRSSTFFSKPCLPRL